jgi:hypothetical protein
MKSNEKEIVLKSNLSFFRFLLIKIDIVSGPGVIFTTLHFICNLRMRPIS